MEESLYQVLCYIMPILAIVVFIALFYIQAGYGIFQNKHWGISIPNRWGWVLMECPAFFFMLYLWISSPSRLQPTLLTFFILFETHYLQRSFIFPLLMRGKSRMPIAIMLMGILFNLINGFMIGEDLFHLASAERYHLRNGNQSSFRSCDQTSPKTRRYTPLSPPKRNVSLYHFS